MSLRGIRSLLRLAGGSWRMRELSSQHGAVLNETEKGGRDDDDGGRDQSLYPVCKPKLVSKSSCQTTSSARSKQ